MTTENRLFLTSLVAGLLILSCSLQAQFVEDGTGGHPTSTIGSGSNGGAIGSTGGVGDSSGGIVANPTGGQITTTGQGGRPGGTLPLGASCQLALQDCQPGLGCYNVSSPDAQGNVKGACMSAGTIKESAVCPMNISGTATLCEPGTLCLPDSNPNAPTGRCYRICSRSLGIDCPQNLQCAYLPGVTNFGVCPMLAMSTGGTTSGAGGSVQKGGSNSSAGGGLPIGTLGSLCSLTAQNCVSKLGCYPYGAPDAQGVVSGKCDGAGVGAVGSVCSVNGNKCVRGAACFPESTTSTLGHCFEFCSVNASPNTCSGGVACQPLGGVSNFGLCQLALSGTGGSVASKGGQTSTGGNVTAGGSLSSGGIVSTGGAMGVSIGPSCNRFECEPGAIGTLVNVSLPGCPTGQYCGMYYSPATGAGTKCYAQATDSDGSVNCLTTACLGLTRQYLCYTLGSDLSHGFCGSSCDANANDNLKASNTCKPQQVCRPMLQAGATTSCIGHCNSILTP